MKIRRYESADLKQILRLFYETVRAVNIKDYTTEQINAWTAGHIDLKEWDASYGKQFGRRFRRYRQNRISGQTICP